MNSKKITTLFLDIGGVLLSNGWGRKEREQAIKHFKLDSGEMNERHHLTFDTYEEGKLSLNDYLKRVIFYEPREFTQEEFTAFMMAQSTPYNESIDFFKKLKKKHDLKVIAISNEGRELNTHRVNKFGLDKLFDAFISSSYVHMRKPDVDIFRMAIDISHTKPERSIYIDDRLMFVQIANSLGMNGLHYKGVKPIKKELKAFKFSS